MAMAVAVSFVYACACSNVCLSQSLSLSVNLLCLCICFCDCLSLCTHHSRGLNLYWFWKIVKIVLGGKAQKGLHVDEDKIRISTPVKSE
jgi:hypothetical protein